MMEKMRPPSPSQPTQAAHGTTPAKNRPALAQGTAGAGDFLGLLTALGDNLLSGVPVLDADGALALDVAGDKSAPLKKWPSLEATATDSSAATASLLALQAGFAGATQAPLSSTQSATITPTDTLSLGGHNALLAAPTVTNALAAGSRGVAVASSGGELGLVAQTAALDGATEAQAEQGLGAVAKKPTASRWASPATEALTARSTLSLRQEPTERAAASQAALVSALQAAVGGADAPRDPLAAGAGQQQNVSGAPSYSFEPPVAFSGQDVGLSSQGQNAGRGGEGGRGASGQNSDAGALFGIDGLMAEPASVGEAPVFDAASALPAEDAVAEQVSYWVNQNIQNAELTVEHAGHPVEVTVSLSGNEAHVSFRSDQNETRALLDASEAQLRDLLESQGLSLSGMTVGDSAMQGDGNNISDPRNGAKGTRQSATVQASVATNGQRSVGTVTDKAVDIFV